MDLITHFTLLSLLAAAGVVLGECPEECQCSDRKILCQGTEITQFPRSIPPTTIALYITNTNITSLKSQDFQNFADALTIFVVKDTGITMVQPGTFDQTGNLTALGFRGTELSDFPEDLFQNLKSLNTLTLSSNSLEFVRSTWLFPLAALRNLDLSRNKIRSVPEDAFRSLRNLADLTLSRNNLEVLPKKTFRGLGRLRTLRLNRNELTEISDGTFDDLVSLEEVSLQDNLITHLPANLFFRQQKLQKLFLSNNRLSILPTGVFLNLPNLAQISLYENELQSLSPGVFGSMVLQELWLYDNLLTNVEDNVFRNLTHLQLLVLSRNQIAFVSLRAFSGLPELREVSLHTNRLTTLDEGVFQELPNLLHVSLENNQIHSLPGKLLHGLANLEQVDLHNNSLTSLSPEFLQTLQETREVMLHQNPWRCDQDIVPLRGWMRQYPNKVNASIVECLSPPGLAGTSVAELTNQDLMLGATESDATTLAIADTTPQSSSGFALSSTVNQIKLHPTLTWSTTHPSQINPTSKPGDGGEEPNSNGVGLSKDTQVIIIAIVCTLILLLFVTSCVCWWRRKHGSGNLARNRRGKTNSVI